MKTLLSSYECGDMTVDYVQDGNTGAVGFELVPTALKPERRVKPRSAADPCIHLKLAGDAYPDGFSQGRTMRQSESVRRLVYSGQESVRDEASIMVVTCFRDQERRVEIKHQLLWREGCSALESKTVIHNHGQAPAVLEMLTSFSFGGMTPFVPDDGCGRLQLHRLRSTWSMEGRHEVQRIEQLQLEPSWQHGSANCLRFGQVGSMPVREFFPWAAVEDTVAGVIWAVQLACPGSWQMEVYRRDDGLCLSGGLADRELGHWMKQLAPGASFETPAAYLTVVHGGLDEAAGRLVLLQERIMPAPPLEEEDLPVIYNEFCSSWGSPSADRVKAVADQLEGHGIRYLVIDCGWYNQEGKHWWSSMGDWEPNPRFFPDGLSAVADYIRSKGMVPGIWFEMEACGKDSAAFHFHGHLLKRDGYPLTSGIRRFFDFRDPWTVRYLTQRMTGLIRENGFGYLKLDYNDSIGIGCDGAESLGEGLRAHLEAVQNFIRMLRRELPELVIESCSSGGHRLEPTFLGLTSMSSFSDAHEEKEIPVIAANLHRVMPPRQNQIWAVIREKDQARRIVYSLVSACLGRMCLSGDFQRLSLEQWRIIDEGIAFYKKAVPVIREGVTRRYGPEISSYRHPEGWQAVLRVHPDGEWLLAVIHTFGGELPGELAIPLPDDYVITSVFGQEGGVAVVADGRLMVPVSGAFQATALLLERRQRQHAEAALHDIEGGEQV